MKRNRRIRSLAAVVALLLPIALLALSCDSGDDSTATTTAAEETPITSETSVPTATETAAETPIATPTPDPTHLPRVEAQPAGRVTALLLGLDRRPNEIKGGPNRTDIIQLITYDPATGQAAIVGFPRDLWVPIPGVGNNRINTAYFWGNYNGGVQGGLDLVKRTVETNFRVKVDFVIAVDFQPFIDIIDDLGGVQLDLPEALNNYNLSAPYTGPNIRLRSGRQVGTGEYALAASRARHPDSDLFRLKRASHTLVGIFEKARTLTTFEVTAIFLKHLGEVETTLSPKDWPELIRLAQGVDTSKIEFFSTGDFVTPFTTPDGAAVLQGNSGAISTMLDEAFPDARTQ